MKGLAKDRFFRRKLIVLITISLLGEPALTQSETDQKIVSSTRTPGSGMEALDESLGTGGVTNKESRRHPACATIASPAPARRKFCGWSQCGVGGKFGRSRRRHAENHNRKPLDVRSGHRSRHRFEDRPGARQDGNHDLSDREGYHAPWSKRLRKAAAFAGTVGSGSRHSPGRCESIAEPLISPANMRRLRPVTVSHALLP